MPTNATGEPRDHAAGQPSDPASGSGPSWLTAGFGGRFLALLVDWLLCLMLAGLISRPPATGFWAYPFLLAEYGFFVGIYTQTPGMWLAKVRCVSTTDAGPIGPARALLRTLLLCLVVPALIMDSYGRGLHDRVAGSIMLSAPRDRS